MGENETEFEAAVVIVNFGLGSKALKIAKHHGVLNATVFLGIGTAKNRILEFLELTDIRKELVLMIAEKTAMDTAIQALDDEFVFNKPNHGIAFTMPLLMLQSCIYSKNKPCRKAGDIMYSSIIAVVKRGMSEAVMEAAAEAGAKGGTIIKARGAGSYEAGKLFHMDIEPEKEIVLILAKADIAVKISESINTQLQIGQVGNGIVFSQDVNNVYGVS